MNKAITDVETNLQQLEQKLADVQSAYHQAQGEDVTAMKVKEALAHMTKLQAFRDLEFVLENALAEQRTKVNASQKDLTIRKAFTESYDKPYEWPMNNSMIGGS